MSLEAFREVLGPPSDAYHGSSQHQTQVLGHAGAMCLGLVKPNAGTRYRRFDDLAAARMSGPSTHDQGDLAHGHPRFKHLIQDDAGPQAISP